ncbi:MAG TPA: LLM class flavin-dependent oxidoreductase [Candidatus Binataceae bacterium]|nr:LLM class flavin-dependent oxidoreductase [Candidatus Binataceae bacterium]
MTASAISLSSMSGISHSELVQLAREAEDAGMSGVYVPEATNDALLDCYGIASATKRITIGTWIVNIYLRDPWLCAAATAVVQDAAAGRFILGLGVSHRPALKARGIEMSNGRDRLRHDTEVIRKTLRGEPAPVFGMRFHPPKHPVPIYFAALALETARLGGEIADGLMLYLCTPERMRKSIDAAKNAAVKAKRKPSDITNTIGLPVFMHENLEHAFSAARKSLAFYATLPFYNRLLARSGFEIEARDAMEASGRGDSAGIFDAITKVVADSVALVGPRSRCLERMAAYTSVGASLPIIVPNAIDEDYPACVRRLLKAFRPN